MLKVVKKFGTSFEKSLSPRCIFHIVRFLGPNTAIFVIFIFFQVKVNILSVYNTVKKKKRQPPLRKVKYMVCIQNLEYYIHKAEAIF